VPFVVATPGGSGSRSMLENRNCIGHVVNDDTRDGDNDVGTRYAAKRLSPSVAEVPVAEVSAAEVPAAAASGDPVM
jgi:hypothetical protein